MTTALREIFATFAVEFDSKEMQKGNEEVNDLAEKLNITNPKVIEFAQGLRAAGPGLAVAAGVWFLTISRPVSCGMTAVTTGVVSDAVCDHEGPART